MIEKHVNLPTLAMIAGMCVGLGIGLGLLIGNRLSEDQRRAAGWALAVFGALITIPLIAEIVGVDASELRERTLVGDMEKGPGVALSRG